jgi:hypothetical protein
MAQGVKHEAQWQKVVAQRDDTHISVAMSEDKWVKSTTQSFWFAVQREQHF